MSQSQSPRQLWAGPGPLAFVCQWPAAGIPLTRQQIDAELILDAATRAQAIFADQPSHHSPGGQWTSYAAGPDHDAEPANRTTNKDRTRRASPMLTRRFGAASDGLLQALRLASTACARSG